MVWSFYMRWLMSMDTPRLFDELYAVDWYRELHLGWLESLHRRPGTSLLEIGCASGRLSAAAMQKALQVTAVDRSEQMLQKAQMNLRSDSGVLLAAANVNALPFGNNLFDCVIAASLINIVDEPNRALLEMVRVLEPSGTLSFLVPGERMVKSNVIGFIDAKGLSGFSAEALRSWAKLAPKLEPAQCRDYAHRAGLQQVQLEEHLDSMVYVVTGMKSNM